MSEEQASYSVRRGYENLVSGGSAAEGIAALQRAAESAPPKPSKADLRARGRVRKRRGEMNATEARFAAELRTMQTVGEIEWYGYECITFRLADRTTYTPDFLMLYATGELWAIDVKGTTKTKGGKHKAFTEEDAKIKIKLAAELFPLRFGLAYQLPKNAGGAWRIDEV
jgi:hypothetical protein